MSKVVRISETAYEELCNRDGNIKEEIDKAILETEKPGLDEETVRTIVREEVVREALK